MSWILMLQLLFLNQKTSKLDHCREQELVRIVESKENNNYNVSVRIRKLIVYWIYSLTLTHFSQLAIDRYIGTFSSKGSDKACNQNMSDTLFEGN